MKLSTLQKIFTVNVSKLIIYCNSLDGFEARLDQVSRTNDQQRLYYYGHGVAVADAGGGLALVPRKRRTKTLQSAHADRRAVDLILDIDGVYQEKTEAYELLGIYWESLHPNNVWGGSWSDGNHFEMKKVPR